MSQEKLSTPVGVNGEQGFEQSLRPSLLKEFIGQRKKIDNLRTYIAGARERQEPLDHVLLHGPPGLGKTTLAHIVAAEMGLGIKCISGPMLDRKGDLTAILTDVETHQVLFIDEIHRLKPALEEILYKAMEDFQIDVIIGQGPGARTISIAINPFTLVGATTRTGLLSSPLLDRFGIMLHLDYYTAEELVAIIKRSARILGVAIDDAATLAIGQRCRGTPRIANRMLRRIRDFAQARKCKVVDREVAESSFVALEVDGQGFDEVDRRILLTIIEKFAGGPVGLSTLATAVQEEKDTLEDVYEPYLIQEGFLHITTRGRRATKKAYGHFQKEIPTKQSTLF